MTMPVKFLRSPYPPRGLVSVRRHRQRGASRRELFHGQAAIEYLVVLAFGVIILLQPFTSNYVAPSAPCPVTADAPALKQVACAIKDYHKHYTYAMSIAFIPDCDYQWAYDKSVGLGDVASLTGGLTVGFDRCIDWLNPAIPGVSISPYLIPNLPSDVSTFIQDQITSYITSAMTDFLNPANLLGDMGSFLNPF